MTIRNSLPICALIMLLMSGCTPPPRPIPATPAKMAYPKFPSPPSNLMQELPLPQFLSPTSTPAPKHT